MGDPSALPRVSVVLIFLNEERFLAEAVESIFAQTYPHWELVLVDDGSQDASTTMARRYAAVKPDQVRYIAHPGHANRGMSASRNLGLQAATGELVAFLDADDVVLPDKLAVQASTLRDRPGADLVFGRAEFWRSWSGDPSAVDSLQDLGFPLEAPVAGIELLAGFVADEYASPCDVMVRRGLALAVNGYEEAFRGMYEDQVFHTKLCLAGATAWVSEAVGYRYRQHDDACTADSKRTGEYGLRRREFLDWVQDRAGHRAEESPLREALAEARWPFAHPLRARAENTRRWLKGLSSRVTG